MTRNLLLIWSLLCFSAILHAQAPVRLSGTVTDSATGKPLPGVSIFLNSTSIGTVTRADGAFVINNIPRGRYQLVMSAIGYETFVTEVTGNHPMPALNVVLHSKATELEAFTVEPYMKDGWQRYGKFFLDNFIGTLENAGSCKIKNKEVLRFHFYRKSNQLSVTATEPLIVDNKALGYSVEFRLERFLADFSSNIITYYGYPFFHEMTTDDKDRQKKWEEHRKLAYAGSIMHFMRSLYTNRVHEDGFIVDREINVPNLEKQRVKEIYNPVLKKTDSIPIDTLHHYWEIMRQPDFYPGKERVEADSLVTIYPDKTKALYFLRTLTVVFGDTHHGIPYRQSGLEMMTPTMIVIEENGNYYPPQVLLSKGYWAQSEKISDLLPADYQYTGF
jgi:carboxypeptidase-like protein